MRNRIGSGFSAAIFNQRLEINAERSRLPQQVKPFVDGIGAKHRERRNRARNSYADIFDIDFPTAHHFGFRRGQAQVLRPLARESAVKVTHFAKPYFGLQPFLG